ncbi:MAG: T9SS type A sorting domain-containing protein [Ignavibacteriales bacterium]|nr:T9SS type A sorting domain-containing protein [Ignavibacteriales bacterium]
MLEQGNLFNTSRLYPGYNPIGMIFENEDYFNDWSLYRKRNGFSGGAFGAEYYSLTQGIGLDSVFVSLIDAFDAYIDLKGCVIDGTVYGDTTLTDIDGCIELLLPTHFVLEQNYPNPFNPSTKINWQSPVAGIQSIRVYDVLGNEVATLVNEFRNAGIYEVDFDASKLSSGVYFYQLKSGEFIQTKKMILIK